MTKTPIYEYLAQPWSLGDLNLKNRVVMASLTRNRGLVPDQTMVEYYKQRAGEGLILSEGILIEPQGTEWLEAPGIWSKKQITGWKKVVDAVHNKGGVIFAQLWHLGRIAHVYHNAGVPPPAPSDVPAKGRVFRLLEGHPTNSVPEPIEDPKEYVGLFKQAAKNAKEAGFDGVELHGANGYLVHQFYERHSNKRVDNYGGSIENRARFALEIIDAIFEYYPPERVGIKLSPSGGYNDMGEDIDYIKEFYTYFITQLDQRKIGYIQLFRYCPWFDTLKRGCDMDLTFFLPLIKNSKPIFNGEFDAKLANDYIKEGKSTAIAFGRDYIPNPDLAYRLIHNLDIAKPISYKSYYQHNGYDKHVGYTDYPFHPENSEKC